MAKRFHSARGDRIETRDPVVISRYRGFTRLNHWLTAACMVVLLVSGLALFHPSLYWLTGLFGSGQMARWLHPIVGLVMFFSFLVLFLQMWKLNLPRREDVEWSRHVGDFMTGETARLPEVGKYNAGQKLVFWAMSVLTLIMILTGIMIWEQYIPLWEEYAPYFATIPARRVAVALHAVAALLFILVFILHVYAAIWTRGTINAMTRGTVTGGWAWRHHRKWLRELAGRQGSDAAG